MNDVEDVIYFYDLRIYYDVIVYIFEFKFLKEVCFIYFSFYGLYLYEMFLYW